MFSSKKSLYVCLSAKIVLPVLATAPLDYPYLLFLFSWLFLVGWIIIDIYDGLYSSLSRMTVYKVVEILALTMLLVYYLVETNANLLTSSKTASIVTSFIISMLPACLFA